MDMYQSAETGSLVFTHQEFSERKNRRSKRDAFLGVLTFSLFLCIFIGSIYTSPSQSSQKLSQKLLTDLNSKSDEKLALVVSNEYDPIQSLDLLPWHYIVEPHRDTKLTVANPLENSKYIWTISIDSDEPIKMYGSVESEGSEISFVFTEPGTFYNVVIEEVGGTERRLEEKVICKYVRRNLYDLTVDDRNRYFDALYTFYTIPLSEGVEKYGDKFINHKELTRLHLLYATDEDDSMCSPWHGGPIFITSHLAFVSWMEQALQLIDPILAIPYWDYIYDAEKYGLGMEWSHLATVFGDDFFGDYNDYPYELSGQWSGLQLSTVLDDEDLETRHNTFNVMTDVYNNDDLTSIRRSNQVCGWKLQEYNLPDCMPVKLSLESTSLTEAYSLLEDGVHGNMHIMLGGVWDCGLNASEVMLGDLANDSNGQYLMETLLTSVQVLYITGYRFGLHYQPDYCDASSNWDECRWTCRGIQDDHHDVDIDDMSDEDVYDFLYDNEFFQHLESSMFEDVSSTDGFYRFTSVEDHTDAVLKRAMLKLACYPGRMSAFSTPLAATDDPLFASTHSYYMRHWSYLLLTKPDFDLTWEDTNTCYGHKLESKLPWNSYNLFGQGEPNDEKVFYDNADILEIYHPANAKLPYVHENFDWDFCGF